MIKNRKQLYWILTISGWLAFGLFKSYLSPFWDANSGEVDAWILPLFTFINPFVMLLFTHFYAFVARRFKLLNLSFSKTVGVILGASLLLIVLFVGFKVYVSLFALNTIFQMVGKPIYDMATVTPAFLELPMKYVYPYMFTLECAAFMIWLSLFHAYFFFENAQIKTAEQYESKVKLQEAELSFLRSQLNPHFLFNALNSIHALSLMQSAKASDAVILLSDLMRYTLNYGKKNLVSLAEEMDIVEKYLELEKIRFNKKLTYQFDIQQNTLSVLVPPIIIQTLTENAIKHAIRQNRQGGSIKIQATISDQFLIVHIINNGQLIQKIDPSVSTPTSLNSEQNEGGIGIENTEKRLAMIYGDKAFFELKNLNDSEVVATLKIPKNHNVIPSV
jgi:two-component system, LytTR family, sensor kinase